MEYYNNYGDQKGTMREIKKKNKIKYEQNELFVYIFLVIRTKLKVFKKYDGHSRKPKTIGIEVEYR